MRAPGRDHGRPYRDSQMGSMWQIMIGKKTSANFASVGFEISLLQTLDDIVSAPWYLTKGTEALLDTDVILEPVGMYSKQMQTG